MKYTEFRDSIRNELERNPAGRTWKEIKVSLDLPYQRPCPTWVAELEKNIGLDRSEKKGRELLWRLKK